MLPPAEQQQVADALEDDAEVMSNTAARGAARRRAAGGAAPRSSASTPTPGHIALQVALLVPILAGLLGLLNSFRMMRLPDLEPAAPLEGVALG